MSLDCVMKDFGHETLHMLLVLQKYLEYNISIIEFYFKFIILFVFALYAPPGQLRIQYFFREYYAYVRVLN